MLTPKAIRGLTHAYLMAGYDDPKPIPDLHWKMWEHCCSEDPWVALAAPREHAKSTAITHAYVLAMLLMGYAKYVLLVSDTEEQAGEFLGDIKRELLENEALRTDFGIVKLLKDTEHNVVVQTKTTQFRILAKGSEQKIRGRKWRGTRPDLILCDDLENDEIVMNPDRRKKFRDWFLKALVPAGSDSCKIRVVGTVLHLDSMLTRLMDNKAWRTELFAAHDGTEPLQATEVLWPEKFSKERLHNIYLMFKEDGDLSGYYQEYLNNPVDTGNRYFRDGDFIPMTEADHEKPKVYVAAADFAISESERADFTVIVVAGMDPDGHLHITDIRRGRWGSLQIIDELFSVQKRWNPEIFTFETAKIDKALGPFINARMYKGGPDNPVINIQKMTPVKSKTMRGRSIQAKSRAGQVHIDDKADWYDAAHDELMTITEAGPKGKHDDIFDALAYIGLTVDEYRAALHPEEQEELDYQDMVNEFQFDGRCEATGY